MPFLIGNFLAMFHRLRDFVAEVDGRLLKLLGSSGLTTSSWLPNVELPSALATKKVLTKNCVTMSMPEIRVKSNHVW